MTLRIQDFNNADLRRLAEEAREGLLQIDFVVYLIVLCCIAGKSHGRRDRPNAVLLQGLNGLSKSQMCDALNAALCGPALRRWFTLVGRDPMVRVQCTPDQTREDLVGSDVIGRDRQMVYRQGPLLLRTFLVLLDEINRAPPKSQAALFSATAERIIALSTLDESYRGRSILDVGFQMMVATQNPPAHEGTYPLPEAALDRFMIFVRVPYLTVLEDLLAAADRPADRAARAQRDAACASEFRLQLNELNPDGDGGRRALISRLLAGEAPGAAEPDAVDWVERSLLAKRVEWFDGVRAAVRDKVTVSRAIDELIAHYVYFTWSESAAVELAPELIDGHRVCTNQLVQRALAGVQQGVMPRGALALRDLAKALRYARTPAEELAGAGTAAVTEKDVHDVAPYVLCHRITLGATALLPDENGVTPTAELVTEKMVRVIRSYLEGRK